MNTVVQPTVTANPIGVIPSKPKQVLSAQKPGPLPELKLPSAQLPVDLPKPSQQKYVVDDDTKTLGKNSEFYCENCKKGFGRSHPPQTCSFCGGRILVHSILQNLPPLMPPPLMSPPSPAELKANLGPAIWQMHPRVPVPPYVRADNSRDLFLIGHGWMKAGQGDAFELPDGITVIFYASRGAGFNSHWEPKVVSGEALINYTPSKVESPENWAPEIVRRPNRCIEHVLGFPANLQFSKTLAQMIPMRADLQSGFEPNAQFGGLPPVMLYVSRGQGGIGATRCAPLSSIVKWIRQKVAGPITLHWCACRDLYDAAAVAEDTKGQPLGAFGQINHQDGADLKGVGSKLKGNVAAVLKQLEKK